MKTEVGSLKGTSTEAQEEKKRESIKMKSE